VEDLVWNCISKLLSDPLALVEEFEKRQEEARRANEVLMEQAEALRGRIRKLEVKLDLLYDDRLEGLIDKSTYKRKRKQIEAEMGNVQRELAQVRTLLERETLTDEHKERLMEFCEAVRDGLECATFDVKRQILLLLDVKVTHDGDGGTLIVRGAFPTQELSTTH